jgi:MFS family permease
MSGPAAPPPTTTHGDGSDAVSGGAWAALAVLTFINLFNYLDRYVVPAVGESIKRSELHPSDAQLGALISAFFLVYIFTAPVFGIFGSRPWRLRLVAVGVAIWSLATAAGGLAHSYGSLLGARAAVGIGEAAYSSIAPAVLADYFPARIRGRVFAAFYAAIPVGSALGFITGGYVDHTAGWRAAFFVAGLPGLIAAALTLTLRNPPPGAHDDPAHGSGVAQPARDEGAKAYLRLLHSPGYGIAVLGYAAYTFAFGGIAAWMPQFMIRVRHLDGVIANSRLGVIVVLTGIAGTIAGGWLGDRFAKKVRRGYLWVSAVSVILAAPCVYIALTATPPAIYWTALGVADLLLFISTGPINVVIVSDVPAASRAAAMAASILTIHLLGDVPSPLLIGKLSDATSLAHAVLIIPVAVLVAGVVWTFGALRPISPPRPLPASRTP